MKGAEIIRRQTLFRLIDSESKRKYVGYFILFFYFVLLINYFGVHKKIPQCICDYKNYTTFILLLKGLWKHLLENIMHTYVLMFLHFHCHNPVYFDTFLTLVGLYYMVIQFAYSWANQWCHSGIRCKLINLCIKCMTEFLVLSKGYTYN